VLGSRLRGKAGESKRRAHLERSLGLSRLYFYSRLVLCVFITGGYRTYLLQQDLLTRSRLACALIKHTCVEADMLPALSLRFSHVRSLTPRPALLFEIGQ
jgi:hypothetical protein